MSVIFGDEGDGWPSLFRATGIKSEEFIRAVLVESVDVEGVLQGVGQEEHLYLGGDTRQVC